jgi:SiaC family regulatory phosphoprotein
MKLLSIELLIEYGFVRDELKSDVSSTVLVRNNFEVILRRDGTCYYRNIGIDYPLNDLTTLKKVYKEAKKEELTIISENAYLYSIGKKINEGYYKFSSTATPEIDFKTSGVFTIKGNSYMPDPFVFYSEGIEWLKAFLSQNNKTISLNISLIYVNTSSTKVLLNIITLVNSFAKSDIKVLWEYQFDDDEMITLGERLQELTKVKFEFKESQ